MSGPALSVRRHRVRARLVGSAGQGRLLDAVEGPLLVQLGRAFPDPEGYWVIRRIDVRTQVFSDWSCADMARTLAGRITRAVDEMVDAGPDPERALWFPDHETFVAHFLLDTARGRAQSRWVYDGLRRHGLGPTPVAALAHSDPELLFDALARLSDLELLDVVNALGQVDVATVVDRWASGGDSASVDDLVECVGDWFRKGRLPAGATRAALVLAVAAGRRSGSVARSGAGDARAVAELSVRLASLDTHDGLALLSALGAGDWATFMSGVSPLGREPALSLVRWRPEDRRRLAAALAPEAGQATLQTPYGGLFVLLQLLGELGDDLDERTAGWRPLAGVPAARALQWLVLTRALPEGHLHAPLADPVVRLAMCVPDDLEPADVEAWLTDHDGEPVVRALVAVLLRSLARRLPGMANASSDHLRRNFLDFDAVVESQSDHYVVVLGAPPVQVLLSMTGLCSGRLVLPFGEEKPWLLTQGP